MALHYSEVVLCIRGKRQEELSCLHTKKQWLILRIYRNLQRKNKLEHTRKCLDLLGSPDKDRKIIHVAGTNGKGSVCAFLSSMLEQGGFRCGLFTSPHLVKINERFQINEVMISDQRFTEAFTEVKNLADRLVEEGDYHPTYFEFLFLMGMIVFKQEDVDYIVLETGLGGRLDATNSVLSPMACVITSISLDHVEYLGDTIEKIAGEKAGIMKKRSTCHF